VSVRAPGLAATLARIVAHARILFPARTETPAQLLAYATAAGLALVDLVFTVARAGLGTEPRVRDVCARFDAAMPPFAEEFARLDARLAAPLGFVDPADAIAAFEVIGGNLEALLAKIGPRSAAPASPPTRRRRATRSARR